MLEQSIRVKIVFNWKLLLPVWCVRWQETPMWSLYGWKMRKTSNIIQKIPHSNRIERSNNVAPSKATTIYQCVHDVDGRVHARTIRTSCWQFFSSSSSLLLCEINVLDCDRCAPAWRRRKRWEITLMIRHLFYTLFNCTRRAWWWKVCVRCGKWRVTFTATSISSHELSFYCVRWRPMTTKRNSI